MSSIRIICCECGSSNILREADCVWDEVEQDWVLNNVYDDMQCEDCGYESYGMDEEPVEN